VADTKISALTSGSPAQSGDILPIDRSGANFRITAGDVVTLTQNTGIPNSSIPNGLSNNNSAVQSQATVAATSYYVTSSNINLPATLINGIKVGTTFRWRVCFTKNANGTGTFSVIIFMGTNGTTSDTAEVTQSLGTMTAVADNVFIDILVTFTAVGASTASFFWTMCPIHTPSTNNTGFYTAVAPTFTGTVSSLNSTTASLKFGLGFQCSSGGTLPTITVPFVFAEAFNLD
jgi:hypothetical protein